MSIAFIVVVVVVFGPNIKCFSHKMMVILSAHNCIQIVINN